MVEADYNHGDYVGRLTRVARVSHSERFVTVSGKSDCVEAARQELVRMGGSLVQVMGSDVTAEFGSQLRTRFLGGMFVRDTSLPLRARVEVSNDAQRCQVSIIAEEALGIGSLVGMADKYRSRCSNVALHLRQLLEDRLVPSSAIASCHVAGPGVHPEADILVSQLERLAELHRTGVLEDAELQKAKEGLLRGHGSGSAS
jgi:hypothetical protein